MKNIQGKTMVFGWLLFWGGGAFAQTLSGLFHFEKFTVSEGLSGNQVQTIFQDSRGFIWIGTNGGLNRYDGRIFKKYPAAGESLTDPNITCLAEDEDGNIWIGTESGLNKLDPFTEKITKYPPGSGVGTIPYKWCNALYLDKKNNFWLSTEKGLALYEKKSNRFINYPIEVFGKDLRINKGIPRIFEDSKSRFWLATSYGMKLFDRATKTYRSFYRTDLHSPAPNDFISVAEDKYGHIWAGTFAGGLFQFNESLQKFEKIEIAGQIMTKYIIRDILPVRLADKDYLLLATVTGLLCVEYTESSNGRGGVTTRPGKAEYMAAPYYVSKFLADKEKNLWWAGTKGLMKMNADRFAYQRLSVEMAGKESPYIFHIVPDIRNPDSVFYLTAIEGWWKYDAAAGKITNHKLPFNENSLLRTINRWYPDKNGYWFTAVEGFGYYDLYKNQLTDLSSVPETLSGLHATWFITKDPTGKFWISMRRSGILLFDPVTKKAEQLFGDTTRPGSVYGNSITDLQTGPDGFMYFCSALGLYRVDPVDRSFKIFTSPAFPEPVDDDKTCPFKILFTKDKRIIVFARMRIYELKNEQLVPVYPAKGLCGFIIENVTAGYNETIWLTTRSTVLKTTTDFSTWSDQASLAGIDPDSPPFEVYARLPDKVFFTGDAGIGILHEPAVKEKSTTTLPVLISRVKYGNKESYLISESRPVKTSYKNAIEIEVSPVSYISKDQYKIMYRLDGWDKEWKELNSLSPLRYEQLPPGTYNFKARSVLANEITSEEAGFSFTIAPPFYRTWWFISLVMLVIGCSILLFYRYRLHAALKMERLRTRIATDLHDDIGATLSSISMYSEAVKNQVKDKLPHLEPVLNKMGENSRDMVNSMSDIVWAISPGNDDGEKLVRRMEDHARDLCAVKNVQLKFENDPLISGTKLSLEQRKNIFLVFKEALNNALKYSKTNLVNISVTRQQNEICLTIKDNGRGFDMTTTTRGNGLKNMQLRTREINGVIEIESEPDKGTIVTLSCPV